MKREAMRLYGPVGDIFGTGECIAASVVAADLEACRKRGSPALDLYLSSDGGMVGEGLAVYAQIQRYPGDVTVRVDGRAASIASVIALAGKRLVMSKGSMLMVHSPMLPLVMANAKRMRQHVQELDEMAATMRAIYAEKTGMAPEKIDEMMEAETWMTAQKAVDLGFADEVDEARPAKHVHAAAAVSLLDCYRNTPAELRGLRAEAALAKLEGLLMRQRMQDIARGALAAAASGSPGGVNGKK